MMRLKIGRFLSGFVVAAALFGAGVANATPYQFTLSGDYSAQWTLDSNVVPDAGQNGVGFVIYDVSGNLPGAILGVADIYFWNGAIGGGVEIDDYYGGTALVSTDGPQLYSGSESVPVFKTGTFTLVQYQGSGSYSLTVTAVPEPETYAMLLAGLGMIGIVVRRLKST